MKRKRSEDVKALDGRKGLGKNKTNRILESDVIRCNVILKSAM